MARTMTLGLTIAAAALSAATAFAQAPAAAPAATPPPGGADSANLTALKRGVAEHVDGLAKLAQEMVDSVFSFGELGFQEVETSKYLTGVLEKNGFTITRGQSGIPTAWVATWGSGKPVIALGSDIDGIPQASQKPGVAYHDPIIEGAPGHGEGHNTGMPLNIVAAIAVKRMMEREKLPGTLMLWPGVAEELRRQQGVVRPRRDVQGRGHHPVHARRQQPRRLVGRCRRQRPGLGRVHLRGRDRAQRRRARGAAARRSTPWS